LASPSSSTTGEGEQEEKQEPKVEDAAPVEEPVEESKGEEEVATEAVAEETKDEKPETSEEAFVTPAVEAVGQAEALESKEEDQVKAEDMNTTVADMHGGKKDTKNISGTSVDPSPYTAWGTFAAIKFSVDYFANDLFDGHRDLSGRSVLVQGIGKVGMILLDYLDKAGCKLLVSDISPDSIRWAKEKFPNCVVVDADKVDETEADVFAPCARGEVVNKGNVSTLPFKIICGAANNQLQNLYVGRDLHSRGVVYCPDYVTNMGGVCSIQYIEIEELSHDVALHKIEKTVRKMLGLTFRAAFQNKLSFCDSVDHVVKKILWGEKIESHSFSNRRLFPLSLAAQPLD